MLNHIIRFSLRQPLLIAALALAVLVIGGREISQLPIDVFPDLNRPRVVLLTEAPGLAPEEVETLITIPLESALNGATGVIAVRSSSGIGLSVIYVEFDWGTDIYTDRQVVAERLVLASDRLPEGIQPQLAPISSIMGQIMMVGMTVDETASDDPTSMLELRQLADWVVRRRLLTIPGVAQVFTMGGEGGGARQVQVLVNPDSLRQLDVSLHQVEKAVGESNENATGGYLIRGPNELLVRSLGRLDTTESLEDLELLVVDGERDPPVLLHQLARIRNGPEISRGTAASDGSPAVMVTIAKQPEADTQKLSKAIDAAIDELRSSLPKDIRLDTNVFRQDVFIERSIDNVLEALRDGGILVVIILFLFLMNFRTTFITLTAIPLSIVITALVFRWYGMSINTMTLGGLAVAIGELVDDAIVDVENIFRRLKENRNSDKPKSPLVVVYQASVEVRSSIVYATVLVVLVFIPLFALGGMEGRLFTPLGVAYIVSILASLLVSLTVTPGLSYWLLPRGKLMERDKDGPVLRLLKWIASGVIRFSIRFRFLVLASVAIVALLSVAVVAGLGRNFLPPFNEGSVQVTMFLPPGTSLNESDRIANQVERELLKLPDIERAGRRTGRAELDEHAEGVNISEILLALDPDSPRTREEQLVAIRGVLDEIPGVESTSGRSATEQPLAHLISHMLSGVKAQIAIKVYGDDLDVLRTIAAQIRAAIAGTDGVEDLTVEQQVLIPQLQIQLDRSMLAQRGLTPGAVNHVIETAMNGRIVSRVLEGEATFDLLVRLDDPYREDLDALRQLALPLPSGGTIPLEDVADLRPDRAGPNTINRENARRRIVIQCNTSERALSEVRDDIQQRLESIEANLTQYGSGYLIEYGGQFESEQEATRLIGLLSIVSLFGMFLVLYSLFRSANLALQVMAALPMAAVGAVASIIITGQDLSVPSMVGFVSLAGIASRNGILLINHYLHLVRYEGESWSPEMIARAGKERLAPVLMTALTSGIGLVPLAMAAGEPGKEILYPVATVIIGGLISCTLLEFFVRPALFWSFARKTSERLMVEDQLGDSLSDDTPLATPTVGETDSA